MSRSLALVGLSGSGKSTVGRMLATALGWPLRDTDAAIVAQQGRPIAAIFADQGEAWFRDLEAEALAEALRDGPAVVATGGGMVLRPANCDLLRQQAYVVWLDASTQTLVARLLAHDEQRPLLAGDMTARLDSLRAKRWPLYQAVADLQIVTDDLTAAQMVAQILAEYERSLAEWERPQHAPRK